VPHKARAVTSSKVAEQRAVALQKKTKSYTLLSSDEEEVTFAPAAKTKKGMYK